MSDAGKKSEDAKVRELKKLVEDNLTKNHIALLKSVGAVTPEGLLSIQPQVSRKTGIMNLSKAESVQVAQGHAAVLGRIEAVLDVQTVSMSVRKFASGDVTVESNIDVKTGEGKYFTNFIPNWRSSEMRDAWVAFKKLVPKYGIAAGWM
jgi:hypothetical protein